MSCLWRRPRSVSFLSEFGWWILTVSSCWAAESPETGVIPYRTVAALYDGFVTLEPKDKLVLSVRILPAPKVKPTSPIELQIRSRQGVLALKRSAAGDLEDFPLSPELRTENPGIASNQPKGSLVLKAAIGVRFSGKLVEQADWYRQALQQANAALKLQGGRFSLITPTLKTLTFSFDPGSRASVHVRVPGRELELRTDDLGKLPLGFKPDFPAEGAEIIFSETPVAITAE